MGNRDLPDIKNIFRRRETDARKSTSGPFYFSEHLETRLISTT